VFDTNAGGPRLDTTNDIVGLTVGTIRVVDDAPGAGFSVSGYGITLTGGLSVGGAEPGHNAVALPITLGATQAFTVAARIPFGAEGASTIAREGTALAVSSIDLRAYDLTVNPGGPVLIQAVLSGAPGPDAGRYGGSLTAAGPSTLTLTSATDLNRVAVEGGTLVVAGAAVTAPAGLTVGPGATLGLRGGRVYGSVAVAAGGALVGTGVIMSDLAVAGTLAPGWAHSPYGRVSALGGLSLAAGAELAVDLESPQAMDRVFVAGGVALHGAALDLAFADGFRSGDRDEYTLIDSTCDGGVAGTFAGLPDRAVVRAGAGGALAVRYAGGGTPPT
jgi:hypothetical protein